MNNTPTEEQEQQTVVDYLEYKGLTFTAIPNSTYTTSWSVKARNTAMGLRPGLPDLLVIVSGHLVFIEMKRTVGGVVSPAQQAWIDSLNKIDNVEAVVCYGAIEAMEYIDDLVQTPLPCPTETTPLTP